MKRPEFPLVDNEEIDIRLRWAKHRSYFDCLVYHVLGSASQRVRRPGVSYS